MKTDMREEAKKEIFFENCDGDKMPKELEYLTSKDGMDFLEEKNIDNLYEFACYLLANNYHLEALLDDYLSRIDELDDFLSFNEDGTLDFSTMKEIIEESYDRVTDWLEAYEEEVDALGKDAFKILGTQFTRKYGNILQSLIKEIVKNTTERDLKLIDYFLPSYDSERQKEIYAEIKREI